RRARGAREGGPAHGHRHHRDRAAQRGARGDAHPRAPRAGALRRLPQRPRRHPHPRLGDRLARGPAPRRLLRPQLRRRPRLRGHHRLRRHLAADHRRRRRPRGPGPGPGVRPRAVGATRAVTAAGPGPWPEDLVAPRYDVWLGSVLPAVAASLGVAVGRRGDADDGGDAGHGSDADHGSDGLTFPEARSAVVALVDGLGAEQLRRRGGHAPFLRTLPIAHPRLACGSPSTTASSTAGLSTGLAAGTHGLVGWQTLMPGTDRLLNHLSWDGGPDPREWQPHPTVFEALAAAGLTVTHVAPSVFERSGLTRATLRGTGFRPADTIPERVAAVRELVRRPGRQLVYVYFGEVDRSEA